MTRPLTEAEQAEVDAVMDESGVHGPHSTLSWTECAPAIRLAIESLVRARGDAERRADMEAEGRDGWKRQAQWAATEATMAIARAEKAEAGQEQARQLAVKWRNYSVGDTEPPDPDYLLPWEWEARERPDATEGGA